MIVTYNVMYFEHFIFLDKNDQYILVHEGCTDGIHVGKYLKLKIL